jgi:hypothetical protein
VSRVFWEAVLSILSPLCSEVVFVRARRAFSVALLTVEEYGPPSADDGTFPILVSKEQTLVLSSGGNVFSGFSKIITSIFSGVEVGDGDEVIAPDGLKLNGSLSFSDWRTHVTNHIMEEERSDMLKL